MTKVLSKRFLLAVPILVIAMLVIGLIALIASEESNETAVKEEVDDSFSNDVPLVYSPRYNVSAFGLEKLHPFDGSKYAKILQYLKAQGVVTEGNLLCPEEVSSTQLRLVHSNRYLETLSDSGNLSHILEVLPLGMIPASLLDWRILKPMRKASGGTILACRQALKYGVAVNIGGGYHHADTDGGGGFCVYSDVPIAIEQLRREKKVDRVLIVDTDAHQGNGFANVARKQSNTFVLDFFDESIYPFPKVEESWSVPLPKGTGGSEYLSRLQQNLGPAIDRFRPDLIVYNAGSDVLLSDPLSSLELLPDDLRVRDVYVVTTARSRGIPIAMVLAGGYSRDSAMAQARSIEAIVKGLRTESEGSSGDLVPQK